MKHKFIITSAVLAAALITLGMTISSSEAETQRQSVIAAPTMAITAPALPQAPELDLARNELEMLAKLVWGEARGCSPEEQRLVVWTVFQRVDAGLGGSSIETVITAENQFAGYHASLPVDPDIYALVAEEAEKWRSGEEAPTHELYAPDLPYYYFSGRNGRNWFR